MRRLSRFVRAIAGEAALGSDLARRGYALLSGAAGDFPGPRIVQIQTVAGCNGRCPICPDAHGCGRDGGTMAVGLYRSLIGELAAAGSVRMLVLMLQNEPLLDPDLGQRVREARAALGPRCRIGVVTNGSLLDGARAGELAAGGLDFLEVSLDALRPETYRLVRPGLDFDRALAGIAAARDAGLEVRVRFVRQRANAGEASAFIRHWSERGVEALVLPLLNRAGHLARYGQLAVAGSRLPWRRRLRLALGRALPACSAPFRHAAVLRDGKVLLCCQDWAGRTLLGAAADEGFAPVWAGAKAREIRRALWSRGRGVPTICRGCSCFEPARDRLAGRRGGQAWVSRGSSTGTTT